jgi:hypothetical protein
MLVYGLVSIAILAFSYFVIIKPITDDANDTVNNALQQSNDALNQSFGTNGSSTTSSSGGDVTADDVYNACVKAIHGAAAGKPGCDAARTAFEQCAQQAEAAGGLAQSSALEACQSAANQTVAALKAAG